MECSDAGRRVCYSTFRRGMSSSIIVRGHISNSEKGFVVPDPGSVHRNPGPKPKGAVEAQGHLL